MGRPGSKRPTDAELEILQIFWESDNATVRDIQDVLKQNRKIAYTSIATIVRIMVDKKYLEVVDARRPQKFRAILSEKAARKRITDDWLQRMFAGSLPNLMRHVVAGRRLSKAERGEIRGFLSKAA